jgi:hypothetical protein
MKTETFDLTSSCDGFSGISDMEWSDSDDESPMETVPDLPPLDDYLLHDYNHYLVGLETEEKGARLVEMATYYLCGETMDQFVWGVQDNVHGEFSPEVNELVNTYNQLNGGPYVPLLGFFRYDDQLWVFFTLEDGESTSLPLSENDAERLSECFAGMDYRNIALPF